MERHLWIFYISQAFEQAGFSFQSGFLWIRKKVDLDPYLERHLQYLYKKPVISSYLPYLYRLRKIHSLHPAITMSRPSVGTPSVVSAINQRPAFERVATDHKDANPVPSDLEINHLHQDDDKSSIEVEQTAGVTKIEALYLVFGNGWKLWTLWR